jgi:chemotaxis protein CheX
MRAVMADAMLASHSFLSEEFLSERNVALADETVFEVFASMLGLEVAVTPPPVPAIGVGDERTAIVGYSGAMRGCCEVQMNQSSAAAVATAMLGGVATDDSDSLDDAVGEIANMIAGGWKDRIPSLSSDCNISPPTVITGRAYKVHMSRPSVRILRCYNFGENYLFLTLRREDVSAS